MKSSFNSVKTWSPGSTNWPDGSGRAARNCSAVEVGPEQGPTDRGVINGDNVITIPKTAIEPSSVGHLDQGKRAELDRALRYPLDVIY